MLFKFKVVVKDDERAFLTRDAETQEPWQTIGQTFELERATIVARCNLDASSDDPVVRDLKAAASAIEDLARSYALMVERHRENGLPRSHRCF